jgi:porin
MNNKVILSATLALLSSLMSTTARAQSSNNNQGPGFTSSVEDPVVELRQIRQRRVDPPDSLFRTSPLTPLRECNIAAEKRIYKATDIKFGTNFNTLFQGLGENIPGTDDFGMATFMSFVATWDGFRKGCPNQGELTLGLEGRWDWGTTDPVTLGNEGLGSLTFTANPFGTYTPTFLVRNLFWRQGSRQAGWMYRIGRVTPDQFLQTSAHLTPLTSFMPIAGTGPFAMGLSDSGLGMFGGLFLSDRVNLVGVVSDANANRANFGHLSEGDFFTAVELQAKIFPVTSKAGYSKLSFWHNDGTANGKAINGSTGVEGWGVFIKHEQELTCDGRAIAIARWGKSYKASATYEQLAGGHFVLYDPFNAGRFKKMGFNADLAGVAYNWVQPTGVNRDESNVEMFYRFPMLPEMDATVSYQAIINPALDPSNDYGSAFSLRLRSSW